MQTNWIAVSRELRDHAIVGMAVPPPAAADPTRHAQPPFAAWFDLMCEASFIDRLVPHKGGTVALRRSELIFGRAYWAHRWNWSEQSLRTFREKLLTHGMIAIVNQSRGHSANVISLTKYDAYQAQASGTKPVLQPEANQSPTGDQPDSNKETRKQTSWEESTRPRAAIDIGFDLTDSDLDEFHATLVYWGLKRSQKSMQVGALSRDESERLLVSDIRSVIALNPAAEAHVIHGAVLAAISTISAKQKGEQDTGDRRGIGPSSALKYFREVLGSTVKTAMLQEANLQAQAKADHHMQKLSLAKREERLEQGVVHPTFGSARPGRSSFATAEFPI